MRYSEYCMGFAVDDLLTEDSAWSVVSNLQGEGYDLNRLNARPTGEKLLQSFHDIN